MKITVARRYKVEDYEHDKNITEERSRRQEQEASNNSDAGDYNIEDIENKDEDDNNKEDYGNNVGRLQRR